MYSEPNLSDSKGPRSVQDAQEILSTGRQGANETSKLDWARPDQTNCKITLGAHRIVELESNSLRRQAKTRHNVRLGHISYW